jgi:FMN phosphatase YigB (HAD superfamily)
VGLITNGDRSQQATKIGRFGIRGDFSVIVASSAMRESKPHRAIFEEACRRGGTLLQACLYLEDDL